MTRGRDIVILAGAARSGTKFLRGVLASSSSCTAVPYDINYVWRHGNEHIPHDALPPDAASPSTTSYIRRTLPRLAGARQGVRGGRSPQIIVEKTVSNTLRLDFVNAVLPEARIVHLVRDGRDVVESAMRMWSAPTDARYLWGKVRHFPLANYRYALWYAANTVRRLKDGKAQSRIWGPRYPGIDEDVARHGLATVCATQWVECVRRARSALERLPADRWIEVRYEALTNGEEEMRRLCEFLRLPDSEAVLDAFRRSMRSDLRGKWREGLSGQDAADALDVIAPELSRYGYAPGPSSRDRAARGITTDGSA